MSKRQVLRGGVVLAAIFAVAVFSGSGSVMGPSNSCTHVGTFHGQADSGAAWMVAITPGISATVGQMVVEWVRWDPTLMNNFPTAVRTTNPMGVWEKVNGKTYRGTWIAYGLAVDGSVLYVARASVISTMEDCDHWPFTYVTEVFLPSQNISTESPIAAFCGTGTETRMLLVQATCPY